MSHNNIEYSVQVALSFSDISTNIHIKRHFVTNGKYITIYMTPLESKTFSLGKRKILQKKIIGYYSLLTIFKKIYTFCIKQRYKCTEVRTHSLEFEYTQNNKTVLNEAGRWRILSIS